MESVIVITSNSNKKNILRELSKNKLLYNLKFYTIDEIKNKIFFSYDNRALEYVMAKYKVNINVAKIYLNNLYYLKDLDNEKIKFLNSLKKELEDNDLLIKDDLFKEYIKNKRVIVYGYNNISKKMEIVLNSLDTKLEYNSKKMNNYKHIVYEAKNIEEEVDFVIKKICELIYQGVPLNKIRIVKTSEYTNILKRYLEIYKIPYNIDGDNSYYSLELSQEFLMRYDNELLEELIESLKEKYGNIDDLITIINKSVDVKNKTLRKEFIIHDLKRTKIKREIYDKAVGIGNSSEDFLEDDYVFWLGFNINNYPVIKKDEDYLSDDIKEKLGIDTSILENRINKNDLILKLGNIKNLVLTYKLSSRNGNCFPSFLVKEMGMEVVLIEPNEEISYSKLNSSIKYAKELDELYKFNKIGNDLSLFKSNLNIKYREYSNEFRGINNDKFLASLEKGLVLAYTNMEMYNECAFHYYLSKVLKIDIYEESFKTIIGTIVHHILEIALKKEINIDAEIMQFVKDKDYALGAKEFFYLEKLSKELELIIKVIKEQEKKTKLNNYLFEEELYVYKDYGNIAVTFKGLIDKVMYTIWNEKEVLAVVDYKTGGAKVDLTNLEFGLNLQLPIYLYLLKKSERFKEAIIGGFYIQKVLNKIPDVSDKSKEIQIKENLRLQGFSNSDEKILELLDEEYQNSTLIKNLKYKKDGSISTRAQVLSNEEMEELTYQVEEEIDKCVGNILDGDFRINPKVMNKINISCTYCKFRDICYVSKKDEVMIGGEKIESNRGTETSSL